MIASNLKTRLHPAIPALVLVALACAGPASAQSPFALTNIGADVRSSDARIDGRGGWGLAESDTLIPSFHNLAGLPGLRNVTVVMSGYAEQSRSEDGADARTTNRMFTPTLRAAVPMMRGRLVLSAGFQALRGTQYDTSRETEYMLPDPADPLGEEQPYSATEFFVREGTQFQIPLGAAWRVNDLMSVGGSLNLVGGVMRERVTVTFDEPVGADGIGYYLTNSEVLEDEISGLSSTWSILLDPHARLSVGASFTTGHTWDVTRSRTMKGLPGSTVQEYQISMPETWAAGAALKLGKRWRCGVEYEAQPFRQLVGRPDWEAQATDAWRIGFGVDRAEAFQRRGGRSNLPLRAGYSLQKWPYRVGGEEIVEKRASIGTGFSFREKSGHLDLALSHAWVGDLSKQGSQDRVWRLTVSIAGMERWW